MSSPFLEARQLSMVFPGVRALDRLDFQVLPGEVHGLLGRNGAGKSTLVNILYGRLRPTSGQLFLFGREVRLAGPADALRRGISLVPQEPMVFPQMSIAENLAMPERLGKGPGFVDWGGLKEKARQVLERVGITLDPLLPLGDLKIAQHQLLSIAKVFLLQDTKLALLDEVTTSIGPKDKHILYSLIREKKEHGGAIVFITHNLREVFEICDRVTVLRDGQAVVTTDVASTTPGKIVELMFGGGADAHLRSARFEEPARSPARDGQVLRVERLSRLGEFEDVSFEIYPGEVVGLAGLRGAGKSELLTAIAGLKKPHTGKVYLGQTELHLGDASKVSRQGIVYLPEDREKDGLVGLLSVADNLFLSSLGRIAWRNTVIRPEKQRTTGEELVRKFSVVTPSLQQQIMYLSGGNKQKVLLARLFNTEPKVYLLDEPTRGIDVQAKAEVLRLVRTELARRACVLVTSPEIEDLVAVCDRIMVMVEGRVVRVIERSRFDVMEIYQAVQGVS